jgi:hypothetical protein
MKLALVFAAAALGAATAAAAAEPNSVTGFWKPEKLRGTVGLTMLQFTADGQVFSMPDVSVVQWIAPSPPQGGAPPRVVPRLPQELLGRYEVRDNKIVIRLGAGGSSTFELTKDGRLCVFPGPGIMPTDGVLRPQAGERQCYQRPTAERS